MEVNIEGKYSIPNLANLPKFPMKMKGQKVGSTESHEPFLTLLWLSL